MKNAFFKLVLAASSIVALGGSDHHGCGGPPIINNNGFDLWCGDSLCYWSVDKGSIAPAPTWHSADQAVDMIGDAVAISQVSDITNRDYRCIEFKLLANIEPTATVMIQMDIYDDGIVDWEQPLPASEWSPYSYLVLLPVRYNGVRFRITKSGSGRALLAQIAAEGAGGACADLQPLLIESQPDGASCWAGDECESGVCSDSQWPSEASRTCGGCEDDLDCDFEQVCGSEDPGQPFLDLYQGCGPAFRHQLGERCVNDVECVSGVCCENVCSTCCSGVGCDADESCERVQTSGVQQFWSTPYQCDPQAGGANTGDECLVHADCASGVCRGSGDLKVCELDGRQCAVTSDCPGELNCIKIGTAGGRCD